ncbi:MAG: protein-glutamate O-methyltransferase CheR [Angelakisella sp.]
MMTLTDKEFQTLVSFIHTKYGINLEKKRILIEGRLSNMLQERGFAAFSDYMEVVFKDKTGAEVTTLLNKLTTNHTFFLREIEHFDFMTEQVLPLFEANLKTKDIRIWSAGCSSGQEPYTMAMAINEYFGGRKQGWDTTILATDISMNALEKAKAATYAQEDLKDVPEPWRKKYFIDNKNGTFTVCDSIRKEVVFRTLNLMEPFKFGKPFDLIFCRNVMIYFDAPTKDTLINKFYDVTAPGGFLFIGHSEVINREAARYTYIRPAIYQKRGPNK